MLKKFGDPQNKECYDHGFCIGHIEARCRDEEDTLTRHNEPKAVRLRKVEDALQLLEEAYGMGAEE